MSKGRKCKVCGNSLLSRQKEYCSNDCKFSDPEYNNRRNHSIENDPSKAVRHRETGKIYKDENNLSGILSRYSEDVLNREYNPDEWELIDIEVAKTIQCKECGWETKDINNRNGMLSIHIRKKHKPLTLQEYWTKHPDHKYLFKKQVAKVEKQKERDKIGIKCEECGKMLKKITVSHLRTHGMTPKEYREKYNIDNLSCQSTRSKLSKLYYQNEKLTGVNYTSKGEKEIIKFLEDLNIKVKPQHRKLGIELDIYISDFKVAVEFNGLYWHSEYHGGKDSKYHLNKTKVCERNGVKLIHIFEDEWNFKKDIVKSRLLNIFTKTSSKIYARKCEVKEVSPKDKNIFLQENHIQGKDVCKVKLGLYHKGELVSIMTFSDLRKSLGRSKEKDSFELSRFCSLKNTSVIGGASKLLKYFERNYKPAKVLTYSDRRWTSTLGDTLYDSLGFTNTGVSRPSYWYMKRHVERIHRYVYAKHKILENFENSDPNLTEWENMRNLGFDRIWDCGTIKYEKVY